MDISAFERVIFLLIVNRSHESEILLNTKLPGECLIRRLIAHVLCSKQVDQILVANGCVKHCDSLNQGSQILVCPLHADPHEPCHSGLWQFSQSISAPCVRHLIERDPVWSNKSGAEISVASQSLNFIFRDGVYRR